MWRNWITMSAFFTWQWCCPFFLKATLFWQLKSPALWLSNRCFRMFFLSVKLIHFLNCWPHFESQISVNRAQTLTIYRHEFHFKLHIHLCKKKKKKKVYWVDRTWSINKGLSKLGVTSCPVWFPGLFCSLHALAIMIWIPSQHWETVQITIDIHAQCSQL